MALPATGSTITMSDIRNFFVSEGQPSTFVLGVLGTYIGISTGNTVSMSSSFGGLGSSTGSYANSKNFNLANLRIQGQPQNFQEVEGWRHHTINNPQIDYLYVNPDGTYAYIYYRLNTEGGCQIKFASPYALGTGEFKSFQSNNSDSCFEHYDSGIGFNAAGTVCYGITGAGSSARIDKWTLTTAWDLSTSTKVGTRSMSTFVSDHPLPRSEYAQINVEEGKLWLMTPDVGQSANSYQYIRQFSFTGNDPVANTPTYDGISTVITAVQYPDFFQVTRDYVYVSAHTQGGTSGTHYRWDLSTPWDIIASNVTSNDRAGPFTIPEFGTYGGWHINAAGTQVVMAPVTSTSLITFPLTTAFDYTTKDLSSVDPTNQTKDFWYPMIGLPGSLTGVRQQYQMLRRYNTGSLYANNKAGTVVGFYDTINESTYQLTLSEGWNIKSLSSTANFNVSSWIDGTANNMVAFTLGDWLYHSTNTKYAYAYNSAGTPFLALNASNGGSLINPPTSRQTKNVNTDIGTSIDMVSMRHSVETSRLGEDNIESYFWLLRDNEYLYQWSASNNQSWAQFGSAYSSFSVNTAIDTKAVNAGFDPYGRVSSGNASGGHITGLLVRHLNNSIQPDYLEFFLYAPRANTIGQFTCSSRDLVNGTWTLQRTLQLPYGIDIAGWQADHVGENMYILSRGGNLYHFTFDG